MTPAALSLGALDPIDALVNTDASTTKTSGRPIVAIVGRANVGKSSLFNRVLGKRVAIVEDLPGTTRDRLYADSCYEGKDFTLVDTGGLEVRPSSEMSGSIRDQVRAALAEADVVLLVVDARDGLTPADWDIAESLRGQRAPVIVVANKADDPKHDPLAAEFNRLGLGDPLPVSAHHGRNVQDLLEKLSGYLPTPSEPAGTDDFVKIAIAGRPNVGKSMLLNRLLGEERAIVSEVPGTTRDSLDTMYRSGERQALLIDTAGVRRRGQVKAGIEYYSVLRTLRAISRSDVTLLVIDGSEGVTAQDLHVAGYIHEACKGMMILVNKWDLVEPELREEVTQRTQERFKFVPYAPVMFISAKLGQGIDKVLPEAERMWQARRLRVPEEELAGYLRRALERHGPPRSGTRQLKVYRVEQTGVNPPAFDFSVNNPELVHFSYRRYLENTLRDTFGFFGSPLMLRFARRRGSHPSIHQEVQTKGVR